MNGGFSVNDLYLPKMFIVFNEDVGVVLDGIVFPTGKVAVCWRLVNCKVESFKNYSAFVSKVKGKDEIIFIELFLTPGLRSKLSDAVDKLKMNEGDK
jgi:hypothetical protein